MQTKKILHYFSYLAIPLIIVSFYILFQAYTEDIRKLRSQHLNHVLILLGFAFSFISLGNKTSKKYKSEKYLKRNIKLLTIILFVLVLLTIPIIIKEGIDFQNSVVLGLLSIILGMASHIKSLDDMLNQIKEESS